MIQVKIKALGTEEWTNVRGGRESVTVMMLADSNGNRVVCMIDCHMTSSIGDNISLPRNTWMMMVQNYRHELKAIVIK